MWEALKEYGLYDKRQRVKDWYDGFTFGRRQDIYNPWSILNFWDKKRFHPLKKLPFFRNISKDSRKVPAKHRQPLNLTFP